MLRRDGCRDVRRRSRDELRCLASGDVLEHDLERRKIAHDARELAIDEHPLAIEHVHVGVGNLAVQLQRDAVALHCVEHAMHARQVGDAGIGIGGGTRGVVLHAGDEARRFGRGDFVDGGVVGQVKRQQRREPRRAQGVRDALYADNLFDTVVVPGMTIPTDLPAMIALRTHNKIDALEAEFPASTKVEYVGLRGADTRIYKVKFDKLGENMLKVRYDGGARWTSLEFFVTEPLETVIKKRANFLVNSMQHKDSSKPWYGAFGDWDQMAHVLRNPEDRDRLSPWLTDSSDDAGNARPAFVAGVNAFFPTPEGVASVERYVRYYLFNDYQDGKSGMQMTASEQ